jgi:hypothetical protein
MAFDLNAVLASYAELVAKAWYREACRTFGTVPLTVYYRAARAGERVAPPIVGSEPPTDEYTAGLLVSPAWTRAQAEQRILAAMRMWPICGTVPA